MADIKNAIVVEGGAMRGVFSTGVLDGFLSKGFDPFDLYIGVSSGACNLASFLAEMPGRNLKIYSDYALRPEFMSLARFLKGGHLMDLDWLWDITISEMRIDLKRIYEKKRPFIVALTDASTGRAIYRNTDAGSLEDVLKASSALPVVYRKFPVIDGAETTDGGIADSIPVREAINMGATRIMVIRTRHKNYKKQKSLVQKFVMPYMPIPSDLGDAMLVRADKYNESVSLIRTPPQGIKIIEINPPDEFRISRLSRKKSDLLKGYEHGLEMACGAIDLWGVMEC
ncbi:patatin-like phospholipase family protein [Desulforegula conservatrix]|uniref:patatin-like phospholipase family protein n=1 Tax=Desulforegula conservatrix TaxID=153026 RepID=UPI0004163AA5|nr:patatin family protein [Desulforegula conservatrix]